MMISCGWCHTNFKQWQAHCSNCGGPLPPRPEADLGPSPLPPPRRLPKGFAFRVRWSQNLAVLAGLAFMLLGAFFAGFLVYVKSYWWATMPGFFAYLGALLVARGWKSAGVTLRAFRHGIPVQGEVAEVTVDKTSSINDQYPWKLVYRFTVEGEQHEDSITSYESTISDYRRGQPLWVLFVPGDPKQNTLYPAVRAMTMVKLPVEGRDF